MESKTAAATYPVTQSWSTLLMNYITPAGLCVPYPSLTFARCRIINPSLVDAATDRPQEHIRPLIVKFTERKYIHHTHYTHVFAIQPKLSTHMINPVDQCVDYTSSTERSFTDSRCWTLSFGSSPRSWSLTRSINASAWNVCWKLGGHQHGRIIEGFSNTLHTRNGAIDTRNEDDTPLRLLTSSCRTPESSPTLSPPILL